MTLNGGIKLLRRFGNTAFFRVPPQKRQYCRDVGAVLYRHLASFWNINNYFDLVAVHADRWTEKSRTLFRWKSNGTVFFLENLFGDWRNVRNFLTICKVSQF